MTPNDLIGFAKQFATLAHSDAGHTYDGNPYATHLEAVVEVLMRYGETGKVMLAAGSLHDVVEDCKIKLSTIEDLFGPKVAALVGALTDEPGENRKDRKAATYPKIKATPGAVQLKLADRIANVENGILTGNKRMFLMYSKEHPEFEKNLRPGSNEIEETMWKRLDYLFQMAQTKFEDKQANTLKGWSELGPKVI
jgi:(p)ppGpp synthase/HD superfamily hydrolase